MVKKLVKYETYAYLRPLLPMFIVLLGLGLLTRCIQFFENDTTAYDIVLGSSIFALVVAIIICSVMIFLAIISRYYKNLFTLEGYLSFTLPVTPAQHIFTKLFVAVMFSFIGSVVSFLAVIISLDGEVLTEVIKAVSYLFKTFLYKLPSAHLIFYIIEVVLLHFCLTCYQCLLFYTCITIGQLARKNRVLLAFGVYFGYYYAVQILSTVFTIVFSSFIDPIVDFIVTLFETSPFATIHIIFIALIIISIAVSAVLYVICNVIIRKKLNLE